MVYLMMCSRCTEGISLRIAHGDYEVGCREMGGVDLD